MVKMLKNSTLSMFLSRLGEMMINDGDPSWKWEWADGYIVVFSEEKFGFLNFRSNYFHMFNKLQ